MNYGFCLIVLCLLQFEDLEVVLKFGIWVRRVFSMFMIMLGVSEK